MDLRQLRCFATVAEELHFGRAAKRLHVAQPAVSQTIQALEKELGLVLFDRSNRQVALTFDGRVLLDESRGLIERFDALVETMARRRRGEDGAVRVGVVAAVPPHLIPRLLAACATEAPEIAVAVRAIQSGRDASDILDHVDFDLALVRGEVDTPGIGVSVVASEPVGVALASDHPLADRPGMTPADLNGEPLITFSRDADPGEYDRIYTLLAAAGLSDLRVAHESHSGAVDASLRLVEGKVGLSLKLESEVTAYGSNDVVWRPLLNVDLDVVVSAIWRLDRVTPALARLLPIVKSLGL